LAATIAAITVAALALLFTVFSFWWLHWRKGKISVGEPRTFSAASQTGSPRLIVELPLVFSNDGAAPRTIQNLEIELSQLGFRTLLRFNNTRDELLGEHRWATQFAVPGRSSVPMVCAFQGPGNLFPLLEGTCGCKLRALLDRSKEWELLGDFTLNVTQEIERGIHSGRMLVYDNCDVQFQQRMEEVDKKSKGYSEQAGQEKTPP
jgi:hypothetical protein